ncbi:MAG: MBL fold metallo-hydrolase [Desulfobacterales bacterium]|nr:MBL fold metallo-hydrolase [Desulfobacterales bacterium]
MKIFDQLYGFLWESMTVNNCNTYFIDGPTRILIDPGHLDLFGHVKTGLKNLGVKVEDIGMVICTHAHPDHIEAVRLFQKTPARIAIHETEWQFIQGMKKQIMAAFGFDPDSMAPELFLKEGAISINGLDFHILHTPGHSPGSVSLYWPEHKVLFTGDLIFKEGVGRTDLPGGDGKLLKKSIKRLADLEIEWLLPGHGEIISGVEAVRTNFDEIENYWFKYI